MAGFAQETVGSASWRAEGGELEEVIPSQISPATNTIFCSTGTLFPCARRALRCRIVAVTRRSGNSLTVLGEQTFLGAPPLPEQRVPDGRVNEFNWDTETYG